MANRFNVTMQLQVAGPNNVRPIINALQSQLQGVNANINPRVSPAAARGVSALSSGVDALNSGLVGVQRNAQAVAKSFKSVGLSPSTAATVNNLNSQINKTVSSVRALQSNFKATASEAERFGQTAGRALRYYSGFLLIVRALSELQKAFGQGVREALEFQREMVRLGQVGNDSAAKIGGISTEIGNLAKGLGTSSAELAKVSVTLRQAGLSADDTRIALGALAKTTVAPTFDNLTNTVEGSIAMMQQFGIQAKDLERSLGAINTVAGAFAVESTDIVTAVRKAGGAFKAASGDFTTAEDSFKQLISLFTAVRQTTRESADEISTGLRTIFSRLQNNNVAAALKEMNIELRFTAQESALYGKNLTGQFVGIGEAVKRLQAATKSLPTTDPRFAAIAEQIGGYRQISRVIPLLQQGAVAQKAFAVAQAGSNSLTRDAEKASGAWLVKLTKLREEFLDFIRTVGENKALQSFADKALKLADAFIKIGRSIAPVIPLLAAVAGVKAIKGSVDFGRGISSVFKNQVAQAEAFKPIRKASGGIVPGVGTGDKVPASMGQGDFVIRRSSAKKIGYRKLERIKRAKGGSIPALLEPQEYVYSAADAKKIGYNKLEHMNRTGALHPDDQRVQDAYKAHYAARAKVSREDWYPARYARGGEIDHYRKLATQLEANVSPREKRAIKAYTGDDFHDINGHLRGVTETEPSTRTLNNIKALRQTISNSRPGKTMAVYRGFGKRPMSEKFGLDVHNPASKGQTIRDKGFLSTSIHEDISQMYRNTARILLRRNTPAAAVQKLSEVSTEFEMLLGDNLPLEYKGVLRGMPTFAHARQKYALGGKVKATRLAHKANIKPNILHHVDMTSGGDLEGLSMNQVLNTAGVIPGSKVNVFGNKNSISVTSEGDWGHAERTLWRDKDGKIKSVVNDSFKARNQKGGAATASYARQVLYGDAKTIELDAAGSKSNDLYSGYRVWPTKFGADGPVTQGVKNDLIASGKLPAHLANKPGLKVSDVLALPGGEGIWSEHGGTFDAKIDPNSPQAVNAIRRRLISGLKSGKFPQYMEPSLDDFMPQEGYARGGKVTEFGKKLYNDFNNSMAGKIYNSQDMSSPMEPWHAAAMYGGEKLIGAAPKAIRKMRSSIGIATGGKPRKMPKGPYDQALRQIANAPDQITAERLAQQFVNLYSGILPGAPIEQDANKAFIKWSRRQARTNAQEASRRGSRGQRITSSSQAGRRSVDDLRAFYATPEQSKLLRSDNRIDEDSPKYASKTVGGLQASGANVPNIYNRPARPAPAESVGLRGRVRRSSVVAPPPPPPTNFASTSVDVSPSGGQLVHVPTQPSAPQSRVRELRGGSWEGVPGGPAFAMGGRSQGQLSSPALLKQLVDETKKGTKAQQDTTKVTKERYRDPNTGKFSKRPVPSTELALRNPQLPALRNVQLPTTIAASRQRARVQNPELLGAEGGPAIPMGGASQRQLEAAWYLRPTGNKLPNKFKNRKRSQLKFGDNRKQSRDYPFFYGTDLPLFSPDQPLPQGDKFTPTAFPSMPTRRATAGPTRVGSRKPIELAQPFRRKDTLHFGGAAFDTYPDTFDVLAGRVAGGEPTDFPTKRKADTIGLAATRATAAVQPHNAYYPGPGIGVVGVGAPTAYKAYEKKAMSDAATDKAARAEELSRSFERRSRRGHTGLEDLPEQRYNPTPGFRTEAERIAQARKQYAQSIGRRGAVKGHAAPAYRNLPEWMDDSPVINDFARRHAPLGRSRSELAQAAGMGTPGFHYSAMDHTGKESKGVINATTEEEAKQLIRQRGQFVTDIKHIKARRMKPVGAGDLAARTQDLDADTAYQPGLLKKAFRARLDRTHSGLSEDDRDSMAGRYTRLTEQKGFTRPALAKLYTQERTRQSPYLSPDRIQASVQARLSRETDRNVAQRSLIDYHKERLTKTRSYLPMDRIQAGAEALAARDVRNNAKVTGIDPSGAVTGVQRYNAMQSTYAPASSRNAGFWQRATSGSRVSRAVGRGVDRIGSGVGRFGGVAAQSGLLAAAFAPQIIEGQVGTIARPRGSQGAAKAGMVAGGALTYGAIGGQIGLAAGGPVGAGIGAIGGAVIGFVTTLREANNEIKKIDFDRSFGKFQSAIDDIANGRVSVNMGIGTVRSGLRTSDTEAARRVADQGGGGNWFDRNIGSRSFVGRNSGILTNHVFNSDVDIARDTAVQTRKERNDILAPSLPALQQIGDRISSEVGIKLKPGTFQTNSRSTQADINAQRNQRLAAFDKAGGKDIAQTLADIQNIPVDQVRATFDRMIVSAALLENRQQSQIKVVAESTLQIQKFSQLGQAVSSASTSILGLQANAEILGALLQGQIAAPKVTGFAEAAGNIGGLDRSAFEGAVKFTQRGLGNAGGDLGGRLGDTVLNIDTVLRDLPTRITEATSLSNDEKISGDVRNAFSGLLGNKDASQLFERRLGNAADSIDPKDLQRRVGENPQKLAEELVKDAFGELPQVFQDITRQIQERGNEFAAGLAQAAQFADSIGETRDRVSRGGLGVARARADQQAARTGRTAGSFLSLETLNAPVVARQQRLAGGNAFNVGGIQNRFGEIRGEIAATQAIRQDPNSTREASNAAAEKLVSLQSEASNLQKALEHLGETSEQSAAIQEKLNDIERERSGQRSFTEKLITASPQERFGMQKNAFLSDIANRQGSLKGFNPEQISGVLDHLRSLGEVSLPGYGGRTGNAQADKLIDRSGNMLGLFGNRPGQLDREKGNLLGQRVDVEQKGTDALQALADIQSKTNDDFIKNLKDQNEQFLNRMDQLIRAANLKDLSNEVNRSAVAKGRAEQVVTAARDVNTKFATGAGDNGIKRFHSIINNPNIGELSGLLGEQNTLRTTTKAAVAQIGGGRGNEILGEKFTPTADPAKNFAELQRIRGSLSGVSGLSPQTIDEQVLPKYQSMVMNRKDGGNIDTRQLLTQALEQTRLTRGGEVGSSISQVGGKIRAEAFGSPQFMTPEQRASKGALVENVAKNRDQYAKVEESIKNVDDLNSAEKQLTETMQALNKAIREQLNANPAPAPGKANGGVAFTPRGTDTVPAMLTKGEFIVNRDATARNRSLLESINGGKPMYAAGGGMAGSNIYGSRGNLLVPGVLDPIGLEEKRFALKKLIEERAERVRKMKEETEARNASNVQTQIAMVNKNPQMFGLLRSQTEFKKPDAISSGSVASEVLPSQTRKQAMIKKQQAMIKKQKEDDAKRIGDWRTNTFDPAVSDQTTKQNAAHERDRGALHFAVQDQDRKSFIRYAEARQVIDDPMNIGVPVASLGNPTIKSQVAQRKKRRLQKKNFYQQRQQQQQFGGGFGGNWAYESARSKVFGFAAGGAVGTDTVPAMLTPGEFIVSKGAAQANMPLLRNINKNPIYRASGGPVTGNGAGTMVLSPEATTTLTQFNKGFSDAVGAFTAPVGQLTGAIAGLSGFGKNIADLTSTLGGFTTAAAGLADKLQPFNDAATRLSQALANVNIPSSIVVQTQAKVDVNLIGANLVAAIKGDAAAEVTKQVMSTLEEKMNDIINNKPAR